MCAKAHIVRVEVKDQYLDFLLHIVIVICVSMSVCVCVLYDREPYHSTYVGIRGHCYGVGFLTPFTWVLETSCQVLLPPEPFSWPPTPNIF